MATQGMSKAEREVLAAAKDPVLQKMLEQERIESAEFDTSLLWRLLGYLKRHRALSALGVCLSMVQAVVMTLPAWAIGLAVDMVRQGDEAGRALTGAAAAFAHTAGSISGALFAQPLAIEAKIAGYAALIFGLIFVQMVLSMLGYYAVQMLGQRVVHDLRMDVYTHLMAMDMGYFHKNPVGRLVNRTVFDTQSLSQFFSDAFSQGVRDLFFILALMVVMFTMDVPLALVLLGIFPLLLVMGLVYRHFARSAMRTTSAVKSRMNSWLAENIAGMRENQLYQTEARRNGEFGALTDAHQRASVASVRAWGILRPSLLALSALATAGVLWLGYTRVAQGVVTVGVLLTFLQYTQQLWVPVRNLAEKFNVVQTALTSIERIYDVLDTPSQMKDTPFADPALSVTKGALEFKNVRFAYPTKPEQEVLRGINFVAKPGEMIALVGDTGAGKSTIVHLISRFYDVTSGAVRLDGHEVREYTLAQLRQGIALVPQDVVIFAGTVRENITLGLEVPDALVLGALRAVRADRFIDRFEYGLDQVMDEGGRTLSAGERQLLSFARALVFNPPLLILDEATANVDTETESLIQQALATLTKGRTSVVVAHRLSTIREADQILVLRHGQIIERGRHQELLDQAGEYARLYELHMSATV